MCESMVSNDIHIPQISAHKSAWNLNEISVHANVMAQDLLLYYGSYDVIFGKICFKGN